jgi:hypothetical protein
MGGRRHNLSPGGLNARFDGQPRPPAAILATRAGGGQEPWLEAFGRIERSPGGELAPES